MRSASTALFVVLVLAGCGPAATGDRTTSATPPSTTSTSASSTTAPSSGGSGPTEATTMPGPHRSRHITATGTVRVNDIEGGGCLTMVLEGQAYSLVGRLDGLRDGQRATVSGYADPTGITTCQGGPVFVVESITPPTS